MNRKAWIAVFAIAFLIHLVSLNAPFFYDDLMQIVRNSDLHDWRRWGALLSDSKREDRILMNLSYGLAWMASHGATWSFHLLNLGFHLVNGWLLKRLLEIAFPRKAALTWIAVLLFLLHPIQAEAVDHIMSYATLLEAFFFFLALYLNAQKPRTTPRSLLWVVLLIAPFAKETGVLIPIALILWDLTLGRQTPRDFRWKDKWGYFLPGLALLYWIPHPPWCIDNRCGGLSLHQIPPGRYFLTQMHYLVFRVWLILKPSDRSFYHEFPNYSGRILGDAVVGIAILVGTIAAAWIFRRRHRATSFFCGFFLIAMAPYNTIVQYTNPFAEYRLYLSNACIFLLIAYGLSSAIERAVQKRLRPALAALFLIATAAMGLGEEQLWADPILKVQASLRNYPDSWKLTLLLGEFFESKSEFQPAEDSYRQAALMNWAHLSERTLLPQMKLIQLYERTGQWAKAHDALKRLPIQLLSHGPPAEYYQHLLFTLKMLGMQDEYRRSLKEGMKYYPVETLEHSPFVVD